MHGILIVIGFAVASLGFVWSQRWSAKILFSLIGLAIIVITIVLNPLPS